MENILNELETPLEQATCLQNMLVAHATDGGANNYDYQLIRQHLMSKGHKDNMPNIVVVNRSLEQFWGFIKHKFSTWAERRKFIYNEFQPWLDYLENISLAPLATQFDNAIERFDSPSIKHVWQGCLDRVANDPEGAITLSRTLLESVCKHILDQEQIGYSSSIDLSELYKLTAKRLNMAPEQHTEKIFKQILGGCSGVVNGLGSLRNQHGDAHGKGLINIRPKPRHAELAVNLAGSMALFLLSTYQEAG